VNVGFAKIGQRLQLDETAANYQGEVSPVRLLKRLARRNQEHNFWIVGRSSGFSSWRYQKANVFNPWPAGLAAKQPYHNDYVAGVRTLRLVNPDVLNWENEKIIPLIADLDAMIVILGTNTGGSVKMPRLGTTWADENFVLPTEAMLNTGRYIIEGLNRMGDRTNGEAPVIWICEDPRNLLTMRDLKWPPK